MATHASIAKDEFGRFRGYVRCPGGLIARRKLLRQGHLETLKVKDGGHDRAEADGQHEQDRRLHMGEFGDRSIEVTMLRWKRIHGLWFQSNPAPF